MFDVSKVGADWVADIVGGMTDHIDHVKPTVFNEENRYLQGSVTSMAGPISYEVNPYMREIIDCCDIASPIREVNLMKGVQITYSTALESIALYYMAHVKTLPIMYITADKELASARIENNFIPMINLSGFADIIRSSDESNTRKTGKTKAHMQFEGGGYLVPFGARNADKMRSYSIAIMLKDEIDAWANTVGKDGDPDALSDARCSGYPHQFKIFRGSTPLEENTSKIFKQYKKGDQRKYTCLCKKCSFPQEIRWSHKNPDGSGQGGFEWETQDGILQLESVCYRCPNCNEPHFETDKRKLFAEERGAHWNPTAVPVNPFTRSYHLPAMYSPYGMREWSKCVSEYLECYDPKEKKVKDFGKYQVFYNNILAMPFKEFGSRISFISVSAHRRAEYTTGHIPNTFASEYSGSPILFLTCTVDVHKSFLAVSVMGWTKDAISYLIDYWRFEVEKEDDDCSEISSPVWGRLRELIEEKEYESDDGKKYRMAITLVDAGYANDTVVKFCADYESGVYPILGRDRAAKNQKIKEFDEFSTQSGTKGYRILVDHYKDRMAPVLRREWSQDAGAQKPYHFNAPINTTDKQLKELTAESREKKMDEKGNAIYFYRRRGRNELWDLLIYGSAAVEILAYNMCIQHFKLERIDWGIFWEYIEKERIFYT